MNFSGFGTQASQLSIAKGVIYASASALLAVSTLPALATITGSNVEFKCRQTLVKYTRSAIEAI